MTRTSRLGEVFDEVWDSLAPELCATCDDVSSVREHLASILLELAADNQLGAVQLTSTAARLIRERYL